jgi:inosose dehydratase
MTLAAATPLAAGASKQAAAKSKDKDKPYAPHLACACYIFEQDYAKRNQKTIDHVDEIFDIYRQAGYHAVELMSGYFPDAARAERNRALLDQYNLIMPICYIGGPMHDGRAQSTIDAALALAGRIKPHKHLEAISFNCDPKADHSAKTDDELQIEAQALERLGAALRAEGLRLLVHQHAPEMANHSREWRYFVGHTTAQNVGLCLDTHWVYRGGDDVMTILREAGPRLGDMHLRNSSAGVWLEELADGDIDYYSVAAELKKLHYRGWLTVELAWDPNTQITRPLVEDLKRSRQYAQRVFGVK